MLKRIELEDFAGDLNKTGGAVVKYANNLDCSSDRSNEEEQTIVELGDNIQESAESLLDILGDLPEDCDDIAELVDNKAERWIDYFSMAAGVVALVYGFLGLVGSMCYEVRLPVLVCPSRHLLRTLLILGQAVVQSLCVGLPSLYERVGCSTLAFHIGPVTSRAVAWVRGR